MAPEDIIRMDWLCDNIKGSIPSLDQIMDEDVPMVKIQGIFSEEERLAERKPV